MQFFEENCLLHQKFIIDDTLTVGAAVEGASKQTGTRLSITSFIRVQCGESRREADRPTTT